MRCSFVISELTDENAKTIGAALIHSKLDYSNAILYGTSQENISSLQRVQNSLARIISVGGL